MVNWVQDQPLQSPLYCIGDGHAGIWKLLSQLVEDEHRLETLDGYHLRENLHKVGGSLQRHAQARQLLWREQVDAAIAVFEDCSLEQAKWFQHYLQAHRHRII